MAENPPEAGKFKPHALQVVVESTGKYGFCLIDSV